MQERIPVNALDLLRRVPLFSGLEGPALHDLLGSCHAMRMAAGSQVFSPEDDADRFFVILAGKVKVYQLSQKGDEQILHLYGPGNTFGEAAMWASSRYPAHAETLAKTTLLAVRRSTLQELAARKPEMALAMIAGMSRKLQEFTRLIEQLSLKEVPARLAGVLLDLLDDARGDAIVLRQTKRELASQIGTIPETLSRAFARLKKDRLIDVRGPEITILDREALAELAES
jgi:CRP/FNR family transcriptional regulator